MVKTKPLRSLGLQAIVIVLLATLVTGCSLFGSSTGTTGGVPDDPRVPIPESDNKLFAHAPGQVLVGLEADTDPEEIASALGARVIHTIPEIDTTLFELPQDTQVVDALRTLENWAGVRYAEPNYYVEVRPEQYGSLDFFPLPQPPELEALAELSTLSASPSINPRQWGLQKIGAPAAWGMSTGKNVVIAVIDTGIDPFHPAFKDKILYGINTVPGNDPTTWIDGNGHGTHVAGIAAGSPDGETVGVAYDSYLLAIKVLGDDGRGAMSGVAEGITKVVEWATKENPMGWPVVINMSLGGPAYSASLKHAVDQALAHDIVVVAAMGNDQRGALSWPAAFPGVIAVGASGPDDRLAPFSSTWKHISVVAPGMDIYAPFPINRGGYATLSGTSMASPFVAGAAALLLAHEGGLSPAQVRSRLESFARHPRGVGKEDEKFGHGVIDVRASLLGNRDLNQYGEVVVELTDTNGKPVSEHDNFFRTFGVEIRLEHDGWDTEGPVQPFPGVPTVTFPHVPLGAGWKAVAFAWTPAGAWRRAEAVVPEVRAGQTQTVSLTIDISGW